MATAASPKRRQQSAAAVTAEQYRSACATLRPDTMRDACRLLLGSYSNRADGRANDSNNGSSDDIAGDKLLDMCRRAKSAADVIERQEAQQRSNASGGGGGMHYPPNSPGGRGGTPKGVGGVGGGQKQQMPRARSSMAAVAAAAKVAPHSQQRKGSLGHVGGPPAKRQRMMHQHQHQQQHGHADEGDAPPEAALSFLKALNQAKPGTSGTADSTTGGSSRGGPSGSAATSSSVTPPPPPPLHGPGSKAKGGSTGQAKSLTTSSTAFPGARAGRSQPMPVGAGRSRPSTSSSSKKSRVGGSSGGAATAGRSTASACRASRAASSSAATSASSSFKPKEVGEDVLVKWTDGNKYAAIIKDVDLLDAGEDDSVAAGGGVVYEVEFDNGEIEKVKAADVLSQSDLEDEDEYEE